MEPTTASRQISEMRRPTVVDVFERMGRFEGLPEQFLPALLAAQCEMAGAAAGAIFRQGKAGPEILALHPPLGPQQTKAPPWLIQIKDLIGDAAPGQPAQIKPVAMPDDMYGAATRRHLIVIPIRREGAISGVGAYLMESRDPVALETARERLELTISLLSLYEMRLLFQRRGTDLRRLRAAMETLAAGNEQVRFAGLAMAMCNEVASRWECDRVSLGFLKGRSVRVRAMSHTEKFSRRMRVIQDMEAAMEECLDQDVEVLYPAAPEATFVSRAAAELSKRQGPSSVLSLPMRIAGQAKAVLMLERPAGKPFTLEEIESLRLAADLATPRLANLEEHDRWVGARLAVGVRKGAAAAVGPKHTWIKLAVAAVFGLLIFMIFVPGAYRVEAPFTVEPIEEQVIPAPFDGYISEVNVEAKDPVVAGVTVLATLETKDLELQRADAAKERDVYDLQARAALRDGKTVEAQIAQAQADKSEAQVNLLNYQIDRARIVSPLTGIVVFGDLKHNLRGPVKMGDVMFKVAQLDSLRAVASIPDSDIVDVKEGQSGELATPALPNIHMPFDVERINPVAEVVSDRNVFKVRLKLKSNQDWLRPGMEGVSKVDIDRRPYGWIWTRPAINWVRMKLWL